MSKLWAKKDEKIHEVQQIKCYNIVGKYEKDFEDYFFMTQKLMRVFTKKWGKKKKHLPGDQWISEADAESTHAECWKKIRSQVPPPQRKKKSFWKEGSQGDSYNADILGIEMSH